jgi:hypothetical protein
MVGRIGTGIRTKVGLGTAGSEPKGLKRSVPIGPLSTLQTDFESCMGNRIDPLKRSMDSQNIACYEFINPTHLVSH